MRIAAVVEEFPVLSETFILNQIVGLINRGVEVDLYAFGRRNPDQAHPDAVRYGLVEHTRYARPLPTCKLQRLISALSILAHHPCPEALQAFNPIRFGRAAMSLRLIHEAEPFLVKRPYDLVHAHFGQVGVRCARLQRLGLLQAPLVTTFYGFDISQRVRMEPAGFYRHLFDHASRVLALSDQMRQQLIDQGCFPDLVTVHHLGADGRRFPFALRRRQGNEPVQLVSVARLAEKKGLEYGIRAVAEVAARRRDLRYTIIGDGPLRPALENLIGQLGVGDLVELAGWRKQDEVVEHLQRSHLLLAPSVTAAGGDQEGTPTVIAEALLMGLPVLSTEHSGIPEMVQDGVSGWLVPERDASALAERLGWMLDHPDAWASMGRAGHDYARRQFEIDHLNDRLVMIYQDVIAATRR